MKKIAFGEKKAIYISSPGLVDPILQALKIRGWSDVTCEEVPDESVWTGATQVTTVTGNLGGTGTYLVYLTPDPEADEAVREALSFTRPDASMTSVLMDRLK